MKKMQKTVMAAILLLGLVGAPMVATVTMAQGAAPTAAPAAAAPAASGGTGLVDASGKEVTDTQQKSGGGGGFLDIVFGSGALGVILWFALFGDGAAALYFVVDCMVLIRPQKLMPQSLINNVQGAMAEGDVMKALKACESEPSPMANIHMLLTSMTNGSIGGGRIRIRDCQGRIARRSVGSTRSERTSIW